MNEETPNNMAHRHDLDSTEMKAKIADHGASGEKLTPLGLPEV